MLLTTVHPSPRVSPTVAVSAPRPATRKVPCKPSPGRLVCERPWSEAPPVTLHPVPPDGRAGASSEFRESIVAGFLPGERRNTIDLSVPLPIGKRLFLQNVRLMAVLPKGQSVLVSIGSPLRFNGNGYAPLGLYTDQKTALKAQVTRDSLEGSGQFTLIVEGNYVDVPQQGK